MENIMKAYIGKRIVGVGTPIVIITGYSTVNGKLHSEYFAFISGDSKFFDSKRLNFKYSTPAPHPIKVDVNLMMAEALSFAKYAIENYLYKLYEKHHNDRLLEPVNLQPTSNKMVIRFYLVGTNMKQFKIVKNQADSPKLRVFIQNLFKVKPFSIG
jgi:hypothetical protein